VRAVVPIRALAVQIGFTAAIAQVVLLRELMVVFRGNEISVGLVLACWLAWTAVGSGLAGRASAHPRTWILVCEATLAAALPCAVVAVRAARPMLRTVPGESLGPATMLLVSLVVPIPICVALGALFGLNPDWKFEVLGLVAHARELEARYGIGPHTISFPRLENADGTSLPADSLRNVPDADFKKLVAVLRLSVPYAGMIVTARERPETIRSVIDMCTQRDAGTNIGIGAYSERYGAQETERQQFMLGDTRSLDEVIGELADFGHITSFCTSGYRCGRTGDHIMKLLKCGHESRFCKLNAVLTFREWLDDFASEATRAKGEGLIKKEMAEIRVRCAHFPPETVKLLETYYARIEGGERDLCF